MANVDLTKYGITGTTEIVHNPSYETLFEEETKAGLEGYEVGKETELGAVNVKTGIYTGRSPKDKYIVMDENSKDTVWWNTPEYPNDNHPMKEDVWATVKELAKKELCNKKLFVVDAFCGANKDTRMAVRFIVEVAWQAHFVTNMFIQPSAEELESFEPDFVVYNASKAKVENYKELGLNSETCVAFNITSKEQVIINTWYGGEMKKGMFSMMNYFLPLKGIASMHCSANADMNGENTAIFFGLSGTGKTTLSTDPKRLLIGDDEHGWDDNGVFNFEGGCYAKVIGLDKESEPDIYNAIRRDALLENVTVADDGKIDFVLGAYMSNGGKSFICCSSTFTDKQGVVHSRIRPTLVEGSVVTDTRANTHYIVTEYGMVNVKGLSTWQKAEAIISVAHPDFRDELIKEAEKMHIWRRSNR